MMTFAYNFQSPEDAKMQMAVLERYARLSRIPAKLGAIWPTSMRPGAARPAADCYRTILALDPKCPDALRKIKS